MDYIFLLPFGIVCTEPIKRMWLMCRNNPVFRAWTVVKWKQYIATRHLHLELVRTFSMISDRNPS